MTAADKILNALEESRVQGLEQEGLSEMLITNPKNGVLFSPNFATNEMLVEMFRMYDELGNWSEVARRLGTVRQVINYWKKVAEQRGIIPQ